MARDHDFGTGLRTRITAVLTTSERDRSALLDEPGVAIGTLDDHVEFGRFEFGMPF